MNVQLPLVVSEGRFEVESLNMYFLHLAVLQKTFWSDIDQKSAKIDQRIRLWRQIAERRSKKMENPAVNVSGYSLPICFCKNFGTGNRSSNFPRKNSSSSHYIV